MAKQFSTPGVTLKEIDISQVISPTGTSVGVAIGKGLKGPVNARKLITTDKEMVQTFGEPVSTSTKDFGIYGALQFLQESGSLYYTRVTNGDEAYSNLYFPAVGGTFTSANSAVASTTITALSAGGYSSLEANEDNEIYDLDNANGTLYTSGAFLVASVGPGTYGNNIGVTLTTCASYSSSASSNNVDWAYAYDNPESNGNPSSASDAIWKKVFKVNVYTRTKSTDSFPSTPSETFYGTIGDQQAPDGSQLNIEDVINGNSKLIYVKAGSGFTSGIPSESTSVTTATALGNGANTSTETSTANIVGGWNFYTDKEKVSMNILMNTYFQNNDETVENKIASVTNRRKDCIGTIQVGQVTEFDVTDLVDESNTQSYSSPSYIAKYVGWSLLNDSFNNKKIFVPNSIFGAVIMARTDKVANVWNAPAGINRGILPVLGQNVKFNETQIGTLYDANLNTVRFIKGRGNVLWGQRTAQRTVSALREIAVRRALLFIEGSIEPDLLPFIFEPNNESTRLRVFGVIDGFLSTVRAGGGLENYKVVVDSTNNTAQDIDNNVLNVDIYVQPVRTIEFINLQIIITKSGVNLAEVTV